MLNIFNNLVLGKTIFQKTKTEESMIAPLFKKETLVPMGKQLDRKAYEIQKKKNLEEDFHKTSK